jgi:hypothetical protein
MGGTNGLLPIPLAEENHKAEVNLVREVLKKGEKS